jgi:hypothetical protein
VLHPKKRQRSGGFIKNLFGGQQKVRRHSSQIAESLQEAELQEATGPGTGIPVVSSSSSWSSSPAEVPYMNAGSTGGALQQHYAVPSPDYIAAVVQNSPQQESNRMHVPPSLQTSLSGDADNSSWQHFSQPPGPADASGVGNKKRILKVKKTRFQEFWDELKDLIRDLLEYSKAKTWKKKILAVTLCCSSVLVFYDLFFGGLIVTWLHASMMWMTHNSAMAVLAFVAIFVVATCE